MIRVSVVAELFVSRFLLFFLHLYNGRRTLFLSNEGVVGVVYRLFGFSVVLGRGSVLAPFRSPHHFRQSIWLW